MWCNTFLVCAAPFHLWKAYGRQQGLAWSKSHLHPFKRLWPCFWLADKNLLQEDNNSNDNNSVFLEHVYMWNVLNCAEQVQIQNYKTHADKISKTAGVQTTMLKHPTEQLKKKDAKPLKTLHYWAARRLKDYSPALMLATSATLGLDSKKL